VSAGELKATFESAGSHIGSVAFSADGNTLVLGCHDRTVKLWEFASGATRTVGVHLGAVRVVSFFSRGELLASGSDDGTVKVWHANLPQDSASLALASAIRALAFTPDSKHLFVGSDSTTAVLDAASGQETTTVTVSGVLAASADANLLAASAPDHQRVVWDVAAAQERAILPVGPGLAGAAFSHDGKTLASWIEEPQTREQHAIWLWDLETSRVRATLQLRDYGLVRCAAFSPVGRTLAAGQQFGEVTLWDLTTGQLRMTVQQSEGATSDAAALAFSNDGKMLAAGNSRGILRLWNVETGELKLSFKGHTDIINSVAFSPNDRTLLSGSADRTAKLWDVVTGQELLTLEEHKFSVHLVAFAPDGKRLATANRTQVKLWLAATEPEAKAFRWEFDPDDADSPRAMINWGARLEQLQRPQDAENAYLQGLARIERLAAVLPEHDPEDYAVGAYIRLGHLWCEQNKLDDAIAAFRKTIELKPNSPRTHNALAWILATSPEMKLRDPKQAVALAQRAVELKPEEGTYWNTLGAAHFRAGDWQAAIAALEKSMDLRQGGDSNDWFFLAMAHWRLGEEEKAREWYDKAVAWMEKNAKDNRELQRFRIEAADLLERDKKTH
jgi:WD40 repeat protein/Tfp pilus assembly protein PilF